MTPFSGKAIEWSGVREREQREACGRGAVLNGLIDPDAHADVIVHDVINAEIQINTPTVFWESS